MCPRPPFMCFVCTPSQMVTLCLFWCPVNTRTLDDCRFSFPWVQVSVSQTDRILSILWPAAMHALVRSLSRPCFRRTFFTRSSIGRYPRALKTAFFAETTPEVAVMVMHACVFQSALFQPSFTGAKNLYASALHVEAVVLQLADLRRLSLSHTWLYSALLATVSSSALFEATLSCPHALSGPVLRTYVSDSSTQSPDALFSIVLKPPTGVFFDHRPAFFRPPTGHRPATDRPSTDI